MRQVKYVSGFGELGVSRHHRDQSKFLLLVLSFLLFIQVLIMKDE